jgi:TM2 domain-containing membrane protein YozV
MNKMTKMNKMNKIFSLAFALIGTTQIANGQNANNIIHLSANSLITYVFLAIIGLVFLVSLLYQYFKFNEVFLNEKKEKN